MHPTLEYQLARAMAADRIEAASRLAARSTAPESERPRRRREGLRFLTSPRRAPSRRSTRPAAVSPDN